MASAGVLPEIMGIGPVPAVRKLLQRLNMTIDAFDVIELNEAFAAQGLAVMRELGLPDDSERVNPNGGAIALGHPLGMSGNRLVLTAVHQLEKTGALWYGHDVRGGGTRLGAGLRTYRRCHLAASKILLCWWTISRQPDWASSVSVF